MTNDEKAKAYDEALEDMRVIYPNLKGDAKLAVEHAFPQLRESEDERVRKELLSFIESVQHSYLCATDRREKWIAYLEKQKCDRMKPIYDARESFESALEKAWNDYHNGYENVDKFEDDYVECAHAKGFREGYLFGIEKQKEQKPAEKQDYSGLNDLERAIHRGFLSAGVENVPVTIIKETAQDCLAQMNPAEWSEEDENKMSVIIRLVEQNSGWPDRAIKEYVNWLKFLRPQPNPIVAVDAEQLLKILPKKQEWTEEDEKMINLAIEWAETMSDQFRFVDMDSTDFRKIVAWLKSLRPSWKPSEEQLYALLIASADSKTDGLVLRELYEQLKKL